MRSNPSPTRPAFGTPRGIATNTGALATARWLVARDLTAGRKWFITIVLRDPLVRSTTFRIEMFAEEWGYVFEHAGRRSWIRVTDLPFVHGQDDFHLLRLTPALEHLGDLVRELEAREGLTFDREHAEVQTDLAGVDAAIAAWVAAM
jgi:hypothetical protein